MKIGIITFHFVPNQGAVLQCWAMQRFLEQHGHQVSVINYCPAYHTVRYDKIKNPFRYALWYCKKAKGKKVFTYARSFARCMYINLKGSDKDVMRSFESFTEKNLNLTKKYATLKALQREPPQMDAYISGSDQLWNPELLDQNFDKAYFLDFGNEWTLRISYAVSIGKKLEEHYRRALRDYCKHLDAVSLREYEKDAVEATGRDVHICIDPALLLDANDYAEIESTEQEKEPYIFVYGFENTGELQEAIRLAKKKFKCRIMNGSPHRIQVEDALNLRDYAPDRFLSLIRYAECIVTNSFHATVFSILYQKEFITVCHSSRGIRMVELLSKLGLDSRLWNSKAFSMEPIQWKACYDKLVFLRSHSEEYIINALKGVPGENIAHWEGETIPLKADDPYKNLKGYAGSLTDAEALKASASGGAAAAFCMHAYSCGWSVFGVKYTRDFKSAAYLEVNSLDDLKLLKGSKYLPAEKKIDEILVFELVKERLEQGRKVLFIGLPCDVGALKAWLNKKDVHAEELITVDLICHGPTLQSVQKAFIEELEEKYGAKVASFSTRYVRKTWSVPYLHVRFENGKSFLKPLYETDLGFAIKYYSKPACYQCRFKGENHAADITVGDYWGLKPSDMSYNRNGVSTVFARTAKGDELIHSIDPSVMRLQEIDMKAAISHNPMFEKSARKSRFYDQFGKDYAEKGLHYAVANSPGLRVYRKAALKNRIQVLRGQK